MYITLLVILPLLGRFAAELLWIGVCESCVFGFMIRNLLVILPLALAVGYDLALAVVVTQTLVELTGWS